MEFAVNVFEMPAHGVGSQTQAMGDLFVGQSQREQVKDFYFTGPEAPHFGRWCNRLSEDGNDFARDFARHGDAAQAGFANGGNEVFGRAVLEQVAAGTGAQRRQNVFRVFILADHDNLN